MLNVYDISITTYCQLFCAGCQRNDEDGNFLNQFEQQHMPVDTFSKIMDQVDTMNNNYLQLCGELGDPMMHPKVDAIIERALKKQNMVRINTNGALRNANWYAELAKNKSVEIHWGIDGLDHETNDKYRRGANFAKAWDNMTTWFNNGGQGEWHFILFSWNLHQVPDVARLARDVFKCKVTYKITPSNSGKDGIQPHLMEQAKEMVKKYAV